jgi:hypothetical protein
MSAEPIPSIVDQSTSFAITHAIRSRELREKRFSAITELIRVVAIKGEPLRDVVNQAIAMARERNAGIEFEVNGVTLQVFRWSDTRGVLKEYEKRKAE